MSKHIFEIVHFLPTTCWAHAKSPGAFLTNSRIATSPASFIISAMAALLSSEVHLARGLYPVVEIAPATAPAKPPTTPPALPPIQR